MRRSATLLSALERSSLDALELAGITFIWRDRTSGVTAPDPFESSNLWFEGWHGPILVGYSGPYREPLSDLRVRAVMALVLMQTAQIKRLNGR